MKKRLNNINPLKYFDHFILSPPGYVTNIPSIRYLIRKYKVSKVDWQMLLINKIFPIGHKCTCTHTHKISSGLDTNISPILWFEEGSRVN